MIRYNWLFGSIFFAAASIASISSTATAIALVFFLLLAIFLPTMIRSSRNASNGQEGDIKRAVVLASLLLFCSLLPQADTNTAVFTSPIENLKNNWHYS